jgi:hypothetical protein
VKTTAAPNGLVAVAVMSAGSLRVGDDVSTTVTLKVPEAVTPLGVVALQATCVVPNGNGVPDAGVHVTGGLGSIWLLAVTVKVGDAPAALVAWIVMSIGRFKMTGVAFTTVNRNEFVAFRLALSVAEHTTGLTPAANREPDAGEQLTAREVLPSFAVMVG